MKLYRNTTFAAIATSIALLTLSPAAIASEPDKAVYHIDNAAVQATKALRNIRNHLDTAPTTKIAVVTHQLGRGIHFFRRGACYATSDARRLCIPEALATG
ncbi:MAG: hypothetical protein RL133_71 [Pseudomonadota bacterium]